MAGCCNPRGCDRMFTGRFASRMASRYRKHGLDRTARRMVELLARRNLEGATVLEIGGGVGEIGLELLRRGAASATNLELSPGYEAEAARLLAEAGLTGRVHRRLLDIAAEPDAVAPADIVVLHRVVCCYPDYPRLLGAAADHTRRQLTFSHPPRTLATRSFVLVQNLLFRVLGRDFRVFAHPPAAMLAVLDQHGLHPARATAARCGRWPPPPGDVADRTRRRSADPPVTPPGAGISDAARGSAGCAAGGTPPEARW